MPSTRGTRSVVATVLAAASVLTSASTVRAQEVNAVHRPPGSPLEPQEVEALAQDTVVGVGVFAEWLRAMDLDPRVPEEVGRFEHDGQLLEDAYRHEVSGAVRGLLVEAATTRVTELAAGSCEPYVKADFPSAGFVTDDPRETADRFEGGFIRTEMVACFTTSMTDPAAVMAIYTSSEFRMEAESRIERIWGEGELSCVETGGVRALLDPTLACNRIDRYAGAGIASEHSQVVRNQGEDPYQDVYFKESLKTFVRIPGGVALHYINYTRSVRLGRLKRAIGGGKIEGSQEGNARALQERISH